MNGSGAGNKREKHSFLDSTLLPCQSTGRRSLSTLELECLSFTHQTICFIRFIFSPSDSAQPDRALMMKRGGHPCIISESACTKVLVCAHLCVCVLCSNNVISDKLSVETVTLTAHHILTTWAHQRTDVFLKTVSSSASLTPCYMSLQKTV